MRMRAQDFVAVSGEGRQSRVSCAPLMASADIFVSHSSLDTQLTRDVCDRLGVGSTSDSGYRVLADVDNLEADNDWPRYLLEWMARCHAAVIMLTENAARSKWVLKEATILSARRALDSSFKLFIVKFPNTETLLAEQGYGPLFLTMIQHVGANDPDSIVATVRRELGEPVLSDTPFDTLLGRLTDVLQSVKDNALARVSRKLNTIPPRLVITQSERTRQLETIARHLVCGDLGSYKGIAELIDELNESGAEVVRNILRLVSPYWVEPAAAGQLPPLLVSSPRRAAAINGARVPDFTGPLYVRRAHGPSLRQQLIPIAGGNHDQLVEHVTQEICTFMRKRRNTPGATNDEVISDLNADRPRWYAILPPPLPDAETLRDLMDRFPTVAFILWTGQTLVRDPALQDIVWLQPEVDVTREQQEHRAYREAEDILAELTT
jgi:hypothetical protein